MIGMQIDREKGQVLIMVAVMSVALFGFVALAVDGGNVYGGRRRMQNAADAAAFAGAQKICFSEWDSLAEAQDRAREAAIDYAVNRNGALSATVDFTPDEYTVHVIATQSLDTFFAGVIGIMTTTVQAEAAAQCSGTYSAGGLWPLAFNDEVYQEDVGCNDHFWVFASDADNIECYGEEDRESVCEGNHNQDRDKCNCDLVLGPQIATADRGWLRLFQPVEPYPDPCGTYNCGEDYVWCWIENGHPGPVRIGDCIVSKPGTVGQQTLNRVQQRAEDIVSIVLWDRVCDQDDDPEPLGEKCNAPDEKVYRVNDFGCIEIVGYDTVDFEPLCESVNSPTCQYGSNVVIIEAIKICEGHSRYDECFTVAGGGSGELPEDWELRAVSLVK